MDWLSLLHVDGFEAGDPLAIAAVVMLACLLSCDNALSYGLVGAYVFRVIALVFAVWIMSRWYLKLLGGGYLLYLAIAHFARGEQAKGPRPVRQLLGLGPFWSTVLVIEVADVVFSIDSIAASIAITQKLWVLIVGSAIGMAIMRVAARGFVWLLERFPRLEGAAFVAIAAIGLQLIAELPVDVLGRVRAAPTPTYATAEEWRRAVEATPSHALEIRGTLVKNLDAPPPPDAAVMRAGQERLLAASQPEAAQP